MTSFNDQCPLTNIPMTNIPMTNIPMTNINEFQSLTLQVLLL